MALLPQMDDLKNRYQFAWIAFLRIALGVALIAKGIAFLSNMDTLQTMVANSRFHDGAQILAFYIAYAHLLGGLLIMLGLLTRLSCFIQLPILTGALFFFHDPYSILSIQSSFFPSLLTFILLLFFLVQGSGEYSIYGYLQKHQV